MHRALPLPLPISSSIRMVGVAAIRFELQRFQKLWIDLPHLVWPVPEWKEPGFGNDRALLR